jgi:hypothetical protein
LKTSVSRNASVAPGRIEPGLLSELDFTQNDNGIRRGGFIGQPSKNRCDESGGIQLQGVFYDFYEAFHNSKRSTKKCILVRSPSMRPGLADIEIEQITGTLVGQRSDDLRRPACFIRLAARVRAHSRIYRTISI